ncbi:ATP-binding cassette domain-containing protein [Candidatus Dojkabacteria bacterium]|nr:ATP-binding cassette domain-containing protein [Candidatus Dojkabacteria bacterium]
MNCKNMPNENIPIIEVINLHKSFDVAGGVVKVLKDISFQVKLGEFIIIHGPSGCGKSTLLHTILGLEKPTKGKVKAFGHDVYANYTEDMRADFRKKHIGMVYQQSNWVKSLSVIENVTLPLTLLGKPKSARVKKAEQILQSLKMLEWKEYRPSELSSGQQQKVALARAIISEPEIIIADEPTGNLDYEAGKELIEMLKAMSSQNNRTVLMVTHDLEYLQIADKAISLLDGEVQQIYNPKSNGHQINQMKFKKIANGNGQSQITK